MFRNYSERRWPRWLATVAVGFAGLTVVNFAAANIGAFITHRTLLHVPTRIAAFSLVPVLRQWRNPRLGWPVEVRHVLPGQVGYLLSALAVLLLLVLGFTVIDAVRRRIRRLRRKARDRRALRSMATRRREIRHLLIEEPTPNRLMLARFDKRRMLATEDPASFPPGHAPKEAGGPVMFLAPNRYQATEAALNSVASWLGPAIILSTNPDVIHRSVEARKALGNIHVFDPLNVSGRSDTTWSPLDQAATPAGANDAARLLHSVSEQGEPTTTTAELAITVLAHLLCIAALSGKTVHDAAYWASDWPSATTTATLKKFLGVLVDHADKGVAAHAERVVAELESIATRDKRTFPQVLETLRSATRPWNDARMCEQTRRPTLPLRAPQNRDTLYVVVPMESRLQPVATAALFNLLRTVELRRTQVGRSPAPLLLVAIDLDTFRFPMVNDWNRWASGGCFQIVTSATALSGAECIGARSDITALGTHSSIVCAPGRYDEETFEYLRTAAWNGRHATSQRLKTPALRVQQASSPRIWPTRAVLYGDHNVILRT